MPDFSNEVGIWFLRRQGQGKRKGAEPVGGGKKYCHKPFRFAWNAFAREGRRSGLLSRRPIIRLEAHSIWSTTRLAMKMVCSVRSVSTNVGLENKVGATVV